MINDLQIDLNESDDEEVNIKQYSYLFNNTSPHDFPEPYNFISDFIIETISGAINNYILMARAKKQINIITCINNYFKYCINTDQDEYINKFKSDLNINNEQFIIVLNKLNEHINNIIIQLQDKLINEYKIFIEISDKEFNIEDCNKKIISDMIHYIKLDQIIPILE